MAVDCAGAASLPGEREIAGLLAAEPNAVTRSPQLRDSLPPGSVVARGALATGIVIILDQLTKAGATALGNSAVTHPVTNAQFSLGLAGGSLTMMVLVTIAGMVAFGAYVVWQAMRGRLPAWVPGLLLGGAASNLADRLVFGAVRDFVPTPWVLWNLADLAVLLGIAGYAWGHLRPQEPTTPRR